VAQFYETTSRSCTLMTSFLTYQAGFFSSKLSEKLSHRFCTYVAKGLHFKYVPGLPDFSWYLIPKPNEHKMYQIVINNPNVRKIFQMVIKYINIFQFKALKNLTQIRIFWFENKPSGNPAMYIYVPSLILSRVDQSFL
jgi:hypothetical protein